MSFTKAWKNILAYLKIITPIYLIGVFALWCFQGILLYPGRHLSSPEQGYGGFELKRPDMTLKGWVEHPTREKAVVFFGGNDMALEPMRAYLQQCTQRSVYLVPYRGFEGQGGTPNEQALVGDGLALVQKAKEEHPKGVAVLGVSLGSGIAVQVARKTAVDKVVLITPYDSIEHVAQGHYPIVPVGLLLRDTFDSEAVIQDITQPIYILRGRDDQIVPPARTDELISHIQHPVVTWIETGHNGVWMEPYSAQTCAFIRQSLNSGKY